MDSPTTETAALTHTPAYRRLTNTDLARILQYDRDGLTQVEIAHKLGCNQATVSRWLNTCQDSSREAAAYLRGSALGMARKIVSKGKPSDLVATLKGINVLEEQQNQQVSLTINGIVLHGTGIAQAAPSPTQLEVSSETVQER